MAIRLENRLVIHRGSGNGKRIIRNERSFGKVPGAIEYAIGQCKIALDYLRELVIKEGFTDFKTEMFFFKMIKPAVYSKLLYYQALFEIEINRQKLIRKVFANTFS